MIHLFIALPSSQKDIRKAYNLSVRSNFLSKMPNTKKNPEQPENRTVCKSDNQGVKEETFIQTSKRGGDGHPGGGDSQQAAARRLGWQGGSWQTGRSHIHM